MGDRNSPLQKPPAVPHRTNPQEHIPPNTSTSSDFIRVATINSSASANAKPTSIPTENQSGSLNGPTNPTRQINERQPPNYIDPPSYQQHVPIVAIGNPGSGKSTILNAIAGKLLFGSGISLGCGLTNQFELKEANGRKFIDTPGVADDTYQKAAGEALTRAFNIGGHIKIIFFITQESGRIVSQDVATMKLVLESVPQIGRNYGIIVNKIPRNLISELSAEEKLRLILSLYIGIKDEFKHDNVLLLPLNAKLDNIKNAILHPSDIHQDLMDFINNKIPDANITPGIVTEIRVDDFEQLSKEVGSLQSELKKNQEMQNAEAEKLLTELRLWYEEDLRRTKAELAKTKEELTGLKQRSENDKMKQEIREEIYQRIEIQQNQITELDQKIEQNRKAKKSRRTKDFNFLDYIPQVFQTTCL